MNIICLYVSQPIDELVNQLPGLSLYNIFCHFTQTVRIIIENPPHRKETQMLYNKIMSNRQNRNLKIKLEARSSKT